MQAYFIEHPMTIQWKPGGDRQVRIALDSVVLLRIEHALAWRIRLCCGVALVSAYDRPDDVLLQAGQEFVVPNNGLLLIETIVAAEILLDAPVRRQNRLVEAMRQHVSRLPRHGAAIVYRLACRAANR